MSEPNPLDELLAAGVPGDHTDVGCGRVLGQLPEQRKYWLYKPHELIREGEDFVWESPAIQVGAESLDPIEVVEMDDPGPVWVQQ